MTMSRRQKDRLIGVGVAGAAFLVVLPAVGVSAVASAVGARPDFQLPFPCGHEVRLESFGHAPALDIFRVPVSETEGNPLIAPADGIVNKSYYREQGAGHIVQIDHGGGWFTTSIHLESRAVEVGDRVRQGELIGRVGKSGRTSNGVPHLHFEQGIDLNGDGEAEWGQPTNERVVQVFNRLEYGEEHSKTWRVTSYNCGVTVARDFSGDGNADVIARHDTTNDLYLFRGNGAGAFLSGSNRIGNDWSNYNILLSAGDFDRDGHEDVIARHVTTSDLHLFRGNGAGGFLSGSTVVGNDWSNFDRILSVGDFNGDRKSDVIARHTSTKDLYLFRGNGSGGFLSGSSIVGNDWSNFDMILSASDFNTDGNQDVIARHATTKDLYLFRGNGSGGFLSSSSVVGNNWANYDRVLSVGDFTGDRKADVIARNNSTNDLYLFRGNGSGGFFSGSSVIGNNWANYDRIF